MKTTLNRLSGLLLCLLFTAGLAGCNTIEGAGRDIESAGDAIEEKAQEHK